MDSDEHGLLSALRKSQLKDGDIRGELYRKAIDALDMGENNYLILLAANIYNALYYAQKPAELHQEFIDAIFHTEAPMSSEEQREAFTKECGEQFGENAVLNPGNLIDSKKFEVKTTDVRLTVDPERSYLIETRVIDGSPYIKKRCTTAKNICRKCFPTG